METPRLTLILLMCVVLCSLRRISGEEVEMKVRAGENITLYCDLSIPTGSLILWIRNCSHENQPSLVMDYRIFETTKHFSFIHNTANNSYDLHITNTSVSDLGLYYCVKTEKKVIKDERGIISGSELYQYGNRTTRLSLAETSCSELLNNTSTPGVSECVFCWNLLLSVCSVCVLLFSIGVYCLCQKKTTDAATEQKVQQQRRNTVEGEDEEVCYASLDVMNRRQKKRKTKRVQCSDFSTYAQVRTETE
ncbi:tyrosine-protein phosphatase non-receptor type substrate 1-like [Danio aesculapii]|uniref:tyrosine-protein phosphatase non-receptor type substrate 1-like n=1 Tax=Danio aesculapii TaxID=1142201 RepID=UPI0024C006A8|nr:tyrosine-protein phosphatase non-receptor type substrate 1-like [Danio aesculapii]